VQTIAVELWGFGIVRLYLVDSRGLEQPQPRSICILRDELQALSQFSLDCAYVFRRVPISGSRGSGGGGASDGEGLICDSLKVSLGIVSMPLRASSSIRTIACAFVLQVLRNSIRETGPV
jgi:hypothetical protein